MNKFKYLTFAIAMVLPFGLQSCLNDDDDIRDRPTALVTVVPQDGGSFVMNLDDATVLIPTNMSRSPYGDKEVRALVNYIDEDSRATERRVKVVWIDSIRTKMPEKTLGSAAADDEKYGKDKDKVEDLTIKFGDHIERATRMLIKEMFDYIKEDLINTNSVRYL